MIVIPYNRFSNSAKVLANALKAKRVKVGPTRLVPPNSVVLNWGCSAWPDGVAPRMVRHAGRVVNPLAAVSNAVNKLAAFEILAGAGVNVPEFTTDKAVATEWALKRRLVARSLLRASGGRGMSVSQLGDPLQEAVEGLPVKLWVKYIQKRKEYRVHVINNKVVTTQEKRRRDGVDGALVRNLENGYVFCRENITPSEARDNLALASVKALGLDFGAVDVIWNEKADKYYTLEVNTACGLEGTTIDDYAQALRAYG